MLPVLKTESHEGITLYRKLFSDHLSQEYRFDLTTNQQVAGIRSLSYHEDDHTLLVSHTNDSKVHLINLMTGKIRWFDHHGTTVRHVKVVNQKILTASWDGTVCLTNYNSLKLERVFTEKTMGRCPQAIITPDNRTLYSFSYDSDKDPGCTSNLIREWSMEDGSLRRAIRLPGNHIRTHRSGSVLINEGKLFTVSNSGYFHTIDCKNGKIVKEYRCDEELQTLGIVPWNNMILLTGNRGNIYYFDASKNALIRIVKAHKSYIMHIEGHPVMKDVIMSSGYDGYLKLWQYPGFELLSSAEVENNCLWSIVTIGNMLITGGVGGSLWIYDIRDPRNIVLKGRIHVLDQSFAYISENFKSFYTSDPELISAVRKDNQEKADAQFGRYLVNSLNNLNVFRDLFGLLGIEDSSTRNLAGQLLQLPGAI